MRQNIVLGLSRLTFISCRLVVVSGRRSSTRTCVGPDVGCDRMPYIVGPGDDTRVPFRLASEDLSSLRHTPIGTSDRKRRLG